MKSYMEQMVEWLDKNHIWIGIRDVYKEARRLLSEEQAQKPTAQAGLDQIIDEAFVDCTNGNFSKADLLAISTSYMVLKKHIRERYRPAPSSDEGSFKILEPNSVEQAIELYRNNPIFNRLVDLRVQEILSRHPSTTKSEDRCGELVKKIKDWWAREPIGFLPHDPDRAKRWRDEIYAILAEFSKDADGKEGEK